MTVDPLKKVTCSLVVSFSFYVNVFVADETLGRTLKVYNYNLYGEVKFRLADLWDSLFEFSQTITYLCTFSFAS